MRPSHLDLVQVHFREQDFFVVAAGFGQNLSRRSRDKTLPPEFDAIATDGFLQADAIGGGHITTVRDSVAALDQFPGRMLIGAILGFLFRMPADGGWIEENFGALQNRQSRALGIPLISAN